MNNLKKYKHGSFEFTINDFLGKACNAPKDESGVYLVYSSNKDENNLLCIGASGKMKKDGIIKHRKGGLHDRISKGKQFDEPRNVSWPKKMKIQNIDKLIIFWFITYNNEVKDIPTCVEAFLIQEYYRKFRKLPDWNEEY